MTKQPSLKGYHSGGHEEAALFSNGYNRNPKNTASSHFFTSTSVPSSCFAPTTTMERLANLNGLSKILPSLPVPTLPNRQATQKRSAGNKHLGLASDNLREQNFTLQASRRTALGLASVALIRSLGNGFALAEDNGYWLTSPIPVPPVYNSNHLLFRRISVLAALVL